MKKIYNIIDPRQHIEVADDAEIPENFTDSPTVYHLDDHGAVTHETRLAPGASVPHRATLVRPKGHYKRGTEKEMYERGMITATYLKDAGGMREALQVLAKSGINVNDPNGYGPTLQEVEDYIREVGRLPAYDIDVHIPSPDERYLKKLKKA